jgi:hypothetical protein
VILRITLSGEFSGGKLDLAAGVLRLPLLICSSLEIWVRGSTVKDRKCAQAHCADKRCGVDRHSDLDSETWREVDMRTCDIVPHEVTNAPAWPGVR